MAGECPFDARAFSQNFNHHDPAFGLNREAIFDEMRASCPVAKTGAWGGYRVLTRYEDVVAAAKDDATFTSEPGITVPGLPATQLNRLPIGIDPPRSFFYRNILAKFFSVRWLNALEPWVRDLVNGLVDDFIETGRADLQTQLGHPLTAKFIMHITGLPGEKWYEFSEPVIAAIARGQEDTGAMDRRGETSRQIFAEIERQRANPIHGDDKVIAFLLSAEPEGRKLTQEEIFGMVELLIDGGFDTTLAALGHSFAYLARNPAVRQSLVDNPDLIPAAVDEFLRWVTPQQGLFRTATRDVELGGALIRKGEKVLLAWPAANHDPAVFPDPHAVKFDRTSNRHVSFGVGAHLCLGINVAKLEMKIAFETVLSRLPDYQLNEAGIVRPPGLGIVNGLEHLPVRFTPGRRVTA
jgi:cytochrome P450